MSLTEELINGLAEYLSEKCSLEEENVKEHINDYLEEIKPKKPVAKASKKKSIERELSSSDEEEEEENPAATRPKGASAKAAPKKKAATRPKGALEKAPTKNRCEYVYGERSKDKSGEKCGKIAKVEIDGKWYCGTEKVNDDGETVYTLHARSTYLSKKKTVVAAASKGDNKAAGAKSKGGLDAARARADAKSKKRIQERLEKSATVRTNQWGNKVHVATEMVVDEKTLKILGHQEKDGSIGPLTDEMVEICQHNVWEFDIANTVSALREKEDDDAEDIDLDEEEIELE